MTDVTVVVGGQYGSEGKGAVCGYLGRTMGQRDLAVRVAGPNAGHTAYDKDGRPWALRSLPVATVTSPNAQLHIAAGSEVDLDVLWSEIHDTEAAGFRTWSRLTIHPSATLLTAKHRAEETENGIVGRIGSTGKGIGAARADRIMRRVATVSEVKALAHFMSEPEQLDLDDIGWCVVEGTQGYGLGLHTTAYPQVTSSDCRAIDFLAMAGIVPWSLNVSRMQVIVVARTYPIRVAGNSGPLEGETTWADLGLPEERTTVTQKIRRVGGWDAALLRRAIEANGGGGWNTDVQLAITMLDQRFPQSGIADRPFDPGEHDADGGAVEEGPLSWLLEVQDEMETDIAYVGTGPNTMTEVSV